MCLFLTCRLLLRPKPDGVCNYGLFALVNKPCLELQNLSYFKAHLPTITFLNSVLCQQRMVSNEQYKRAQTAVIESGADEGEGKSELWCVQAVSHDFGRFIYWLDFELHTVNADCIVHIYEPNSCMTQPRCNLIEKYVLLWVWSFKGHFFFGAGSQ